MLSRKVNRVKTVKEGRACVTKKFDAV